MAHPLVLDEPGLTADCDHDVRPEARRGEGRVGVAELTQSRERRGGDHVERRGVEERTRRHDRDLLVGNGSAGVGVPVFVVVLVVVVR